jgi:hypothetical protein
MLLEDIKKADGSAIAGRIERLDGLLAEHRPFLSPQLAHFLENRSYAKAAQLLGGASDIPAGRCGGRD